MLISFILKTECTFLLRMQKMFPNFIDRHTFGPNMNYIYKMSVKYHHLSLHWCLPLKKVILS